MPFTEEQRRNAEDQQRLAAEEPAERVRLIAGPGTGKSRTIEKRVCHVLSNGTDPRQVFVISFTRATCAELKLRVCGYCAAQKISADPQQVHISTMHSLADSEQFIKENALPNRSRDCPQAAWAVALLIFLKLSL